MIRQRNDIELSLGNLVKFRRKSLHRDFGASQMVDVFGSLVGKARDHWYHSSCYSIPRSVILRKSFFNTPSLLGKFLVIVSLSCFGMALPNEASAQPLQTYRYDLQTNASEFAKQWFGPTRASERSQNLNWAMRVSVSAPSSIAGSSIFAPTSVARSTSSLVNAECHTSSLEEI